MGAAILWGVLVTLASCDEESTPVCPTYEVGVVEGHVLVAGEGRSVLIGARAQEGESRGYVVSRVRSDSTGWYRLELPTGLYRIETDPSNGGIYTSHLTDTLTVTPHVHRFDILRGSLELRFQMPPDLEGEGFRASVQSSYFPAPEGQVESIEAGVLRFEFPVLPPGDYCVSILPRPYGVQYYLPGTYDRDAAEALAVGSEEPVIYEDSFVDTFGSISGSITGSWQAASTPAPYVRAYSADSIRVGTAHCEEDGSFRVPLLDAEPVRMLTAIRGLERWVGGGTFAEAEVYPLGPGVRITDASVLESGILVSLEGPGVWDRPLSSVRLIESSGQLFELSFDWENPLKICNLPAGEFRLLVYGYCLGEHWASQWYDGAETLLDATPIVLGPGELRRITMHLVEGGRIEGRVLSSGGEALSYADMRICDAGGAPLCGEWHTQSGGGFTYTGLADGIYYLAVRAGEWDEAWWFPGTFEFKDAAGIEVRDHATVDGIEWSLPSE